MKANDVILDIQSNYVPTETYLLDDKFGDLKLNYYSPLYWQINAGDGYIKISLENGEVEIKGLTLTEASQKFWETLSSEYKQFVAWKESFDK